MLSLSRRFAKPISGRVDVMGADLRHFAINADDVDATRQFYEGVLGWRFTAWGPPEFFQIDTGGDGDTAVHGALQTRRELVPGERIVGFECTFAVDDVDATARAVVAQGGRIIMERTTITGVGHLVWFADPSGNVAGAMQYDENAE
jgi:predicted enzyme related to lactoylglutathione lyase